MTTAVREALRQRADYTHKFNTKTGRHGWLRLTPAYSLKIVEEIITQYDRPMRIFDPFCGTATTALSAAYHGHEGVTTDINPFLVWLGKAKTAHYTGAELKATRDACTRAISCIRSEAVEPIPSPPIHNIDRWWNASALLFLRCLRASIECVTAPRSPEQTLLLVAFCRTLIALSNAAFNHQSMSFKDDVQLPMDLGLDMGEEFAEDVRFVLRGAAENPVGTGRVMLGDSRYPATVVKGPFDRVITSPPYANRMSYIRELRPYMYWLGFLLNGRDAGELDWSAIGGTWGVATSRLLEWQPNGHRFESTQLDGALEGIAHHANKSGRVLANYVAKYFDDMWMHFQGIRAVLAPGAEIHYIVGNSTFYGVLLPVEQLYAEMLARLGFEAIECRPIRKRNSKKELIEFDVVARWPGR
jgi:hypothetical protein